VYISKARGNDDKHKTAQNGYNGKEKRECVEAKSRSNVHFWKRNTQKRMHPSISSEKKKIETLGTRILKILI
jgi:hypothetical protein